MATVELCPGSTLGEGFQLLVGLAEIHVPRMWVEEDDKGHHVSEELWQNPRLYRIKLHRTINL